MSPTPSTATPASLSAPASSRQTLFAGVSGPFMLRGPQVAFAPETDTGAAPDGPLSMDDAVSLLTADPAPDDGDDAGEDTEDTESGDDPDEDEDEAGDQPAAEDEAPEDDPASDESEDEDEEPEPDPDPVVEPPRFWSAEEKALFAKAPPEVQRIVAAKDAEYSRQVSLAKEETATARKEAAVIAEFGDKIGEVLERAETIFQGKWDGIDWAALAKEDTTTYAVLKEEHAAEQAELSRLRQASEAAQIEEHRQFKATESVKLAELCPDLADPVEGPKRKVELRDYLRGRGYSAEDLKWAGAKELDDAYCAMRWRQAQARAKADPPKPAKSEPAKAKAPKPAGPVRPAAAAPPRKSVIQRRRAEVVGRAFKTGRMDDAVAAVLALEGK